MGKTISEKIISEHAGRELKAGDISVVDVDVVMSQDGTGPLAVSQIKKMGFESVKNPEKSIFFSVCAAIIVLDCSRNHHNHSIYPA